MPSKIASKPGTRRPMRVDDLDHYRLDDDDPFAEPPQPYQSNNKTNKRKRIEDTSLGLDEEVSVAKKVREPRVKLDENLLSSDRGLPELRRRAGKLKLKGKGHELRDGTRLLSFYRMWLDDIFPKARFADALKMVEKAGHSKSMAVLRKSWIDEGIRATNSDAQDPADDEPNLEDIAAKTPAPRPTDDEDIYNATPQRDRAAEKSVVNDVPEDDDLDALIAESEVRGVFNGQVPLDDAAPASEEDGPDELDALFANDNEDAINATLALGQGKTAPGHTNDRLPSPDFAAEEEAMAELDDLW